MQHDHHEQGVLTALQTYGLTKAAGIRDFMIGDPSRYLAEMRNGELFTRRGAIAQGVNPHVPGSPGRTALNVALNVLLPAYGLHQTAQTPASSRGSALGSAVGGLAGGLIGAPLGLVGGIAGSTLGASLGEGVGRIFNKKPPMGRSARVHEFYRNRQPAAQSPEFER